MALLKVDIGAITENFVRLKTLCDGLNIGLAAVTKLCLSDARIVLPLVECGAAVIADSGLGNLGHVPPGVHRLLLKTRPSDIGAAAGACDSLLVSDMSILRAIDSVSPAGASVLLSLDLGDLRDGILPHEMPAFVGQALKLRNITLGGVAVNFGCLAGKLPDTRAMETLSFCIRQVREETGYELPAVSLGGTAVYDALVAGTLCPEVTQVRMGEAFLFGFNTTAGRPIRGFRRDAFRLYGEIIEIREKRVPSEGTFGLNAFGKKADLGPTGIRWRAVVAFGQLVCAPEGLMPMDHGIRVAGATHDYTVLDLTDAHGDYAPGDSVGFFLSYGGAAQAMLSPCVDREFLERTESPDAAVRLVQER